MRSAFRVGPQEDGCNLLKREPDQPLLSPWIKRNEGGTGKGPQRSCVDALLRRAPRLTVRASLACERLKLWDEVQRRRVGFPA